MRWYGSLRMLPKIILPVGVILIIAFGALGWQIRSLSSDAVQRTAERELAAMAGEFGNSARLFFEFALNEAEGLARALAQAKEDGNAVSREAVLSMVRGLQKSNPDFLGAAVAWEPNAFDGRDSFYVPSGDNNYAAMGSGPDGRFIPYAVAGAPVEPLQDLDESDYYSLPKRRGRSSMITPFFYKIDGRDVLMTTASAVVTVNGRFSGVVMVDLALDKVNDMLSGVKAYETGWAAMLAQDGAIVAFHDAGQIGNNILDTPHVGDRGGLQAAIRAGRPFLERHDNGKALSFYYYYPITFHSTGQTWYFVISAPLDEVLADALHISRLTLLISGAALLLILLVMFVTVRSSVKPLGVLAGAARDISGGNLRVSIRDEAFGGELKELSVSLKEMIASLLANIDRAEAMSEDAKAQARKIEETVREAEAARGKAEAGAKAILAAANDVETVAAQLSASTDELAAQVEQSSKGAELQRERLGSSAAAMEEMNSTALEVARNAEVAADSSEKVKDKARYGENIVQQSVESIGIVQKDTLELRRIMEGLGKRAESIGNIMTVISDIADQTNLLALNAAIEAARAGDAGRGFAVVADEVRKLAEKTMAATKEVGEAIHGIQAGARQSVDAVGKAAQNLDSSTALVQRSGVALQEILHEVDATAAQVTGIAAASEEQSAASDEISRSLDEINSMACETAAAMQQSALAVSDLAQQTRKLQSLVTVLREGGSSA